MRSTFYILFLAIGLIGCQNQNVSRSEYWHNNAAQIEIGSTRSEVEKLLPPHPMSPGSSFFQGSGQVNSYWVDEEWKVTICYDYTGVLRDENGTATEHASPQNLVTKFPLLENLEMPEPLTPDSTQTSNQGMDLTR